MKKSNINPTKSTSAHQKAARQQRYNRRSEEQDKLIKSKRSTTCIAKKCANPKGSTSKKTRNMNPTQSTSEHQKAARQDRYKKRSQQQDTVIKCKESTVSKKSYLNVRNDINEDNDMVVSR